MGCFKVAVIVTFLCMLLAHAASQNLIKNSRDQKTEHQLLINEVNADNPGLDTSEFVELYHTSGQSISLEGYSLVFYNGKFNTAYKVFNLNGFFTDDRGFFLVGSSTVTPLPSVILSPNTIQNGPDAIALYFGRGTYRENMRVTNEGLVDALVHKSKDTDRADILLSVLTPGKEAFLEDPFFRTMDESIERCPGPDSQWIFQISTPSPGQDNHCGASPPWNSSLPVVISEISTVFYPRDFEFVELQGPPSTHLEGLVLVLFDGKTKSVYFSLDIQGSTTPDGLFVIGPAHPQFPVQQLLPANTSLPLLHIGPDAVALYVGNSSSFLPGSSMTVSGLIDALVYTSSVKTDSELLNVLTPGKHVFYENVRHKPEDESVSRCSCCSVVRDPSVYVLSSPTPGQVNDCPKRNFSRRFKVCLRVPDCTKWISSQASYEIKALLVQKLDAQCSYCDVSEEYLKDSNLTCQSSELVFETLLLAKSAPQLATLADAFTKLLERSGAVYFKGRNATMEPTCFHGQSVVPSGMPDGTSRNPATTGGTDTPTVLLINEVNPDNPGGREDAEFVELFHPGRRSASLDGYWLVLFNGKNGLSYEVIKLLGYRTNERGYFLLGSSGVTPRPDIVLPANTIQNGVDAVALYYSRTGTFRKGMTVTEEGLVDAVVYQSRASEKADRLLNVLTPGQDVLHEDELFNLDDESLSRCEGLSLRDLSSFQVTNMTPSADNACLSRSTPSSSLLPSPPGTRNIPPDTSSLVINELSMLDGPALYQFIELKGNPGTVLDGHYLLIFEQDRRVLERIPLQGRVRMDGLFVIGLDEFETTDQHLRPIKPTTASDQSSGAVALYRGGVKESSQEILPVEKDLVDAVVFTWDLFNYDDLLHALGPVHLISYNDQRMVSLSRCSCCPSNDSLAFAVSDPSPGLENVCPTQDLSVLLEICLQHVNYTDPAKEHQGLRDVISKMVDLSCSCGFSQFYLQGLDFTGDANRMRLSVTALARSPEQQTLIMNWYRDFVSSHHGFTMYNNVFEVDPECATPLKIGGDASGSFQAWELSLIILASLLVITGIVALLLYCKRRRPQNYTTIEMNNQRETSMNY